ncbi:MAG: GatB/YqeY domain-containing protein [Candidatus Kapabacteria bacterium]|nr:GatB/YqeY domain-containing protein [Candidatus Kapabacteria bacterium]MCS7169275.1 GatB/YqeY domain-containing protein [Candidatus Kapabacteria bacterium]MDW7996695.1 GatB/YqeY domain-containing protein [Bacteroidota bacterium]MDW8225646.1 GatB/YqeY domain-containing protein [Bacteroidota bacterium]
MGLLETVAKQLAEAMRQGDKVRVETLRLLRAALIEATKAGEGVELTPEREYQIVRSAIKKRQEAIEQYERAGRLDAAARERQELAILESFLPPQLGDDELRAELERIIAELGAVGPKDFGRVMREAMQRLRGRAEGDRVQFWVRQLLGQ